MLNSFQHLNYKILGIKIQDPETPDASGQGDDFP